MPAAQNIPSVITRSFALERELVVDEAREVPVSLTSEAPVEDFPGIQIILDHGERSVRLDRLRKSGPFLWNHNENEPIGVLSDVKLADRKLNARARFSKNPFADEKYRDVKDGILRNTSARFRIMPDSLKLVERTDKLVTYRCMDWEPYEGSLTSVPGDFSTGVGRSASQADTPTIALPADPLAAATPTVTRTMSASTLEPVVAPDTTQDLNRKLAQAGNEALSAERSRVTQINDIAGKLRGKINGIDEKAASFVRDGKPVEEFQRSILVDDVGAKEITTQAPALADMEKDAKRKFSVIKVLRSHMDEFKGTVDIGFEREVSQAIRKASFRSHTGELTIPSEAMGIGRRSLNATTATAGGYTVANDLLGSEFIEKLDAVTVVGRLGTRRLSGLVGNVSIARQTGGATAYWVAEGAQISQSQATFDQVALTPKTVGASTPISKQLIAQSSLDAEAFARQELMMRIALAIDAAAFTGTGANGQPQGIFNKTVATTAGTVEAGKVSKVTFGAAATYAKLINFVTQMLQANAPLANAGWVINPTTYGVLATAPRISGAAAGFLFEGRADAGTMAGYPAFVTNQSTTVALSKAVFGAWNQMIYGDWAGMDVVVDPYTRAAYQEVVVTTHTMLDFVFRHLEAFVVSTDSAAQ